MRTLLLHHAKLDFHIACACRFVDRPKLGWTKQNPMPPPLPPKLGGRRIVVILRILGYGTTANAPKLRAFSTTWPFYIKLNAHERGLVRDRVEKAVTKKKVEALRRWLVLVTFLSRWRQWVPKAEELKKKVEAAEKKKKAEAVRGRGRRRRGPKIVEPAAAAKRRRRNGGGDGSCG